jgi:hypothetical protein
MEFDTSSEYYHWPHMLLDRFPTGKCSVDYYLNGIRWSKMDFEVVK